MRDKKRSYKGIIILILLIGVIVLIFGRNYLYLSKPIVKTADGKDVSFYIPTGSDYQYVKDELASLNVLKSNGAFDRLAKKTHYNEKVHPGRYILTDGMTNQQLINMLRMGHQTPVKVVFNNMRTVEQLAGRISEQIEADSLSIINEINNNPDVDATTFIPNTYEFYWNTDAAVFVAKMVAEHDRFWNEARLQKAKDLKLTPREVSILASIVDKETTKVSEMPRIAGVAIASSPH